MKNQDAFLNLMDKNGTIEVFSITPYCHPDSFPQIEFVVFETDFGIFVLNVDIDTDQLFWSKEMPSDTQAVMASTSIIPFVNLKFIISIYWNMKNSNGYFDAIQFYVRTEKNSEIEYSYMQFIAEACHISCYEFGRYISNGQ